MVSHFGIVANPCTAANEELRYEGHSAHCNCTWLLTLLLLITRDISAPEVSDSQFLWMTGQKNVLLVVKK